jgi:Ca-activated chloride channel family protein
MTRRLPIVLLPLLGVLLVLPACHQAVRSSEAPWDMHRRHVAVVQVPRYVPLPPHTPQDRNQFDALDEAGFLSPLHDPLSSFSADVDTASYAVVRRFLQDRSELPPEAAVRLEELINYFQYDYAGPGDATGPDGRPAPLAADVEVTAAPWAEDHRLVRVGVQAREMDTEDRPSAHLVFLIDVSGSMNSPDKLPLVVDTLTSMLDWLRPDDRVTVVTYAQRTDTVIRHERVERDDRIRRRLQDLTAGGATRGSRGLDRAYELAERYADEHGINRVILATDADFNEGTTDRDELIEMVRDRADQGISLSILGVGLDNLQDGAMEALTNVGDGDYAYLDDADEARRTVQRMVTGGMQVVARDVKLQVEFNPTRVARYRLLGYENRALEDHEFDDDDIDAGEVGAGHQVTALYEVVPLDPADVGDAGELPGQPRTRYTETPELTDAADTDELLTVRIRYQHPRTQVDGQWVESPSQLIEHHVVDAGTGLDEASPDTRFAAAAAGFGMLLRGSDHSGDATWDSVVELARSGVTSRTDPLRPQLVQLARTAQRLQSRSSMR